MSGGQRQAVAIARTRLSRAQLVLMDEPTAAISVRQVAEVLELIRRMKAQGVSVMLISHRMPDVFAVCDRIIVLRRGTKVADKVTRKPLRKKSPVSSREPSLQPETATPAETGHAAIADVVEDQGAERPAAHVASQPFWVTVALASCWSSTCRSSSRASARWTMRPNHAQLRALRHHGARHDGGHHHRRHRSVGGFHHGACRHRGGLFLTWEYPWYVAFAMGLLTGIICGAVNGFFVAYLNMPSFVVTLGMLSIARSLAVVISGNQMLYKFGPDAPIVKAIGQARFPVQTRVTGSPTGFPQLSSHFWVMIVHGAVVGYMFNFKALGAAPLRHRRQRECGTPHRRPGRLDQVPGLCVLGLHRGVASLLLLGYNGSAINAMGQGYELRVIAATVIGGANLMGGAGSAFGAIIGAAFLEVIRNALLMAGIDSNWQGAFVGAFIILAVLLGLQSGGKSLIAASCWSGCPREAPLEKPVSLPENSEGKCGGEDQ
jgi:ribose transport system permease protein